MPPYNSTESDLEDEEDTFLERHGKKLRWAVRGAGASYILYHKGDKIIDFIKNNDVIGLSDFLSKLKIKGIFINEETEKKLSKYIKFVKDSWIQIEKNYEKL